MNKDKGTPPVVKTAAVDKTPEAVEAREQGTVMTGAIPDAESYADTVMPDKKKPSEKDPAVVKARVEGTVQSGAL